MEYRIEKDSMGEVQVQSDKYWAAQTERSRVNFQIGVDNEKMPIEIIKAFSVLKKACAITNHHLHSEKMPKEKLDAISLACTEILDGILDEHFPLVVWQTGSGTQTNMNLNEVISNRANEILKKNKSQLVVHPNDDVNMSQSSNDTFPSSIHISAVTVLEENLIPTLLRLITTFERLESENKGIVKIARTHLQDAVPISFSQEISGWTASLKRCLELIRCSIPPLYELSLGATAVGTGLNAKEGFDTLVASNIAKLTNRPFTTANNKFHALTSKDEIVFAHGAVKALAADLMKIANDVRWLASGPRCGLGEITIPENEPGSSIMPGKINPTQCEALTMVCVQVMGNDSAISIGASQGNFQLNVFMPLIAYNFLQSVRLLSDAIESFNNNCAIGIRANKKVMNENLEKSLMTVTALNPFIGYEKAATTAKKAFSDKITLKEACISLGFLSEDEFDSIFKPEKMTGENN